MFLETLSKSYFMTRESKETQKKLFQSLSLPLLITNPFFSSTEFMGHAIAVAQLVLITTRTIDCQSSAECLKPDAISSKVPWDSL